MTCNIAIINGALGGNITSYTDKSLMSLLPLTPDNLYLAFINVTLDYNEASILSRIYTQVLHCAQTLVRRRTYSKEINLIRAHRRNERTNKIKYSIIQVSVRIMIWNNLSAQKIHHSSIVNVNIIQTIVQFLQRTT